MRPLKDRGAAVALACDPRVQKKAGKALATWHLAREYGFTDMDGTRPHWGEYFAEYCANE